MFKLTGLLDRADFLERIEDPETVKKKSRKAGTTEYLNVPAAFDIEASSFYDEDGEKCSLMYVWQFGLNGDVTIGRTWEDFNELLNILHDRFSLGEKRRLIIYVHNLGYEFAFLYSRFVFTEIFARESRSPIKAFEERGFEFRCSYYLSGMSLEATARDLCTKYPVKKLVGDLDYDKMRTPETELTEEELGYCVNDVLAVMSYIQQQIEEEGDITKLPLTNTGRVRNYCREHCLSRLNFKRYSGLMRNLTISGPKEYGFLKQAFQGGFTHASAMNGGGNVFSNVSSYDFASSYPAVMLLPVYPMSKGRLYIPKDVENYRALCSKYCVIGQVKFYGLKEKVKYDHILSLSKCYDVKGAKLDNGRVIEAEELSTTITEIDFKEIELFYDYEKVEIGECYYYRRARLPKPFIECVLHFYEQKTALKHVEGEEAKYQRFKGMLNSCYGMTVTDIVNDEVILDEEGEWGKIKADEEDEIERYNNAKTRFLFYPWGVYVTAAARRNLYTGILELKDDYLYSDTDSVKFTNEEAHTEYFKKYNDWITEQTVKTCKYYNIPEELVHPKNKDGEEVQIGVWDREDPYELFKTLGAKRYLVQQEGKVKCTIAGVNKKQTSKWLNEQAEPFKVFDDSMEVPAEHSGRMIVCYIEDRRVGTVKDYNGLSYYYDEPSGVHMEKSSYNMTITSEYLLLLHLAGEYLGTDSSF